jgi:ADP-ribose pyrophosphatase YjhB (NUDIX family)
MPDKIELIDIDLSKYSSVSSTSVRNTLLRNPMTPFSVDLGLSINAYHWIKCNEMYKQNPDDYQTKEAAYILTHSSSDYPRPSVTADIVVTYNNKVLLIRRGNYPYKNYWSLPGGFFNPVNYTDPHTGEVNKADLDINYTAQRELKEETGLEVELDRFKQIKTYAHKFDPRGRIVDVAFSVELTKSDFDLVNSAIAGDDASELKWFGLIDLPKLAFHHKQIIFDMGAQKKVR